MSGLRVASGRAGGVTGWGRRYPPLAVVAVALSLAIFTLPSALNLPQANPGQTQEYAPVPGNGNQANSGNFAGLGQGEGGNPAGEAGLPGDNGLGLLQPPLNPNQPPPQYQCVGNPARQTEDPLSPPCVAYFKGDNGGATWVGVTRTEVRVVFRFLELQGQCHSGVASGPPCPQFGTGIFDMDVPSDYNQYFQWQDLHNWEVYFNKRYQTYGRHVHFYVFNNGDTQGAATTGYSADTASADAAQAATLKPFASWDILNLFSDVYSKYMADHGAVNIGWQSQKLASQYPGQYWSYSPPIEYVAQDYATYVCTKVIKPGKVTFSGNNDLGSNRVYGLLLTDYPQESVARAVQDLAVKDMHDQCGFTPADTEYFHYCGAYNTTGPKSGWGPTNIANFQKNHVTTVIWPDCEESEDMKAADQLHWYPEWLLLGDGLLDGDLMSFEPTTQMQNAWVVSPTTELNSHGHDVEEACYNALIEVNPTISQQGSDIDYACGSVYGTTLYDDIRQLFTGIQIAGPKLTPANMNQGFHAIPPKPSPGPTQAACYYLPNDYTCVKDAVAEWFDTTTPVPSDSSSGCWRMWRGGARYLPGQWPAGDVMLDGRDPARDPCNLVGGGYSPTGVSPN